MEAGRSGGMYYQDDFPLHSAAIKGDVDAIDIMHKKFDYSLTGLNAAGLSPILLASAHNQPNVIVYLVENGVDVNEPDHISGATAMTAAILNGSTDAICTLHTIGSDLNLVDAEGRSCMHVACVSASKNVQTLRWLASMQCDTNARDYQGLTPLHLAAKCNHVNCAEALVREFAVDVNVRAENGITPLYMAARMGHAEMIMMLSSLKADLNLADNENMSPCGVAALFGQVRAVRAIHDAGGSCILRDKNGVSPYEDAVSQGHVEVATLLRYILQISNQVCCLCRCKPRQNGLLKCKSCRKELYCSEKCRVQDFPSHKVHCQRRNTKNCQK